jgi:polyisoprenoid-binding protein YceI
MADTWNIDSTHSSILFSVRHLVIAKVHGKFTKFSGTLSAEGGKLSGTKVSIDASSIDTAEPQRDGHLKSADFFDVAKFPTVEFVSKRVEGTGKAFAIVGDLTMHGVTNEVKLAVESEGSAKDPWGNERQAYSAKASLNRTDFGLKWNQALEAGGVLVGEKIEITLEVQAISKAAPPAAA